HRALGVELGVVAVPLGSRALPLRAPARRAVRHRPVAGADRRRAAVAAVDVAAAEEAQPAVIEALAVEVVDRDAHAGRADERVHLLVLEERLGAGLELVAVVLADYALAGARVVRLADAGEQHHLGIAEREGRQDDDAG